MKNKSILGFKFYQKLKKKVTGLKKKKFGLGKFQTFFYEMDKKCKKRLNNGKICSWKINQFWVSKSYGLQQLKKFCK